MITIDDIRKLGPCYDPTHYLPEDWQGTLSDILNTTDCPAMDRIWVVTQLLSRREAIQFSLWCARRAVGVLKPPDAKLVEACDTVERYLNGDATYEETLDADYYACKADSDCKCGNEYKPVFACVAAAVHNAHVAARLARPAYHVDTTFAAYSADRAVNLGAYSASTHVVRAAGRAVTGVDRAVNGTARRAVEVAEREEQINKLLSIITSKE